MGTLKKCGLKLGPFSLKIDEFNCSFGMVTMDLTLYFIATMDLTSSTQWGHNWKNCALYDTNMKLGTVVDDDPKVKNPMRLQPNIAPGPGN